MLPCPEVLKIEMRQEGNSMEIEEMIRDGSENPRADDDDSC